jgi:ribA/ribD-fused uncharacterized protein
MILKFFKKLSKPKNPGEVKELGRRIRNFDQTKWNDNKYEIVKAGNIHKFQQNKNLGEYLINTGSKVIVEASPTDTIWGIGLSSDSSMAQNPYTWRGENLLGFALMEARDFLDRK